MHGDHGTHVAGDRHGDAQRMPITIRQALLDLSRMLGERARHVPGYMTKRSPSCGAEAARMSAREQKHGYISAVVSVPSTPSRPPNAAASRKSMP